MGSGLGTLRSTLQFQGPWGLSPGGGSGSLVHLDPTLVLCGPFLKHFGKQGQVQGNGRPNSTEHWVQLLAQLCNDSQLVHYLQNSTIQHSLS